MGYLNLAGGGLDLSIPDFSKAVISLWFRIPAESVAAAQADIDATFNSGPPDFGFADFYMHGFIPLLVWGPLESDVATGSFSFSSSMTPSMIGVYCGGTPGGDWDMNGGNPSGFEGPRLYVKMQYSGKPVFTGFENDVTFSDFFEVGDYGNPPNGFVGGARGTFSNLNPIGVTTDHWHHLLVSFDVSGSCSATADTDWHLTTDCMFWWAFDDANNTSVGPYSQAANLIGTVGTATQLPYSVAAGALPVVSYDVGIPAQTRESSKVLKVEMAELQFFTGVSLDTSVVDNRRLFLTSDGFPADPAAAVAVLGTPNVSLLGQSNWLAGINGGTAGNFTPTGTINPFTPGPSIGA